MLCKLSLQNYHLFSLLKRKGNNLSNNANSNLFAATWPENAKLLNNFSYGMICAQTLSLQTKREIIINGSHYAIQLSAAAVNEQSFLS